MNKKEGIIKRINKSVLVAFLLFLFFNLNAQVSEYTSIENAVIGQFKKSIDTLRSSIKQTDPYGIWISVMISEIREGDTKGTLYQNDTIFGEIQRKAKDFVRSQKFWGFEFDNERIEVIKPGKYIYAVGIFAELVTNNPAEYSVSFISYTYKKNVNGKLYQYVIHTSAAALIRKPDNGSIVTDVYYYDKDGNALLWDKTWGDKMPEIAYTRIAPGNDESNTKKSDTIYRSPDIGGKLAIADTYNPGYYMPIVKFRGCTQKFTYYARFQEYEAVLRLEKDKVHWKYLTTFDDGTVIPESTLKTETMRAGDLKSFYSKGNTIKGKVLDNDGNAVKERVTVVLCPMYLPADYTDRRVSSKSDGSYEFNDVESGVYSIYVVGNKKKSKTIEVCNCPQNKIHETQNYTYDKINVNYKPLLYSITAEYTNPKLLNVKYRWDNVTIGFPENLSVLPPEANHVGNEDLEMYDIKPPFTITLPPYGKFSFYSNMPERNEEGYLVSKEVLHGNFSECNIDGGTFVIKKVAVESPYIFAFLEFSVELITEDSPVPLMFPVAVGCLNDEGPYTFKWNKLDEVIIAKLNSGESAVKTLTNQDGAKMVIRFKPQK